MNQNLEQELWQLRNRVQQLQASGLEIVFVDECCFTARGYMRRAWAPVHQNLQLYHRALNRNLNCVACCGAISSSGKVHFDFVERAFNGDQFGAFFEKLHLAMGGVRYAVLLDNCSVHKSNRFRDRAKELGVEVVFNVAY